MKYTVLIFKEDDGRFSAIVPALNHTASFGDTIEEALAMVQEAAELYVETVYGEQIDLPEDDPVINVDMSEYSEAYLYKIEIGRQLSIA